MKKTLFLFLLLLLHGFSYFNYGTYCTCDGPEDCKNALYSCKKIVLGKDIDNLEIFELNRTIDCNGHKIEYLSVENFEGTIENCRFENSYHCLLIKGKTKGIIIKNNSFIYCNFGIKSETEGNISIINNTFKYDTFGIKSKGDIKIKNNTFYRVKNYFLCDNCSQKEIENINKNNLIFDQIPKTVSTSTNEKKENSKNDYLTYILIVIFLIIVFGILFYVKKYKKENEDEFKW